MMLWFKAWRESRARFLLSTVALTVICASFVFFHRDASNGLSDEPLSYLVYVWRITYKGYLRELFMILAIMLGIGGLARERDHRTAGFTLALPVSRWRLLVTRTLVGLGQVVLLATLPAIVLPVLSPLIGQAYPASQAWAFTVLWATVGSLIFATSLLASVLFTGEFTAPVVAILGLAAYSFLADMRPLERYLTDIHDVMSGIDMPYFAESTGVLTGPLPWATMFTVLLAAAALIATGARITDRQDF
jgi:ABC-type transport system involved in multi-copper enzyme maturation permease subunit